jgi:hypothetical protein
MPASPFPPFPHTHFHTYTHFPLGLCPTHITRITHALKVEHGITELVNGGVDIVEWMLRLQLPGFLAPLHLDDASNITRSGWSIEVC